MDEGPSKTMVESLTKGLAGTFMTADDSDSTIELLTQKSKHYLLTSKAPSRLQFTKTTPFHTPIEPPASQVHFGETTMPSGGETFRKAAEST